MENVYIMEHPLIQHKISLLRDKSTGTNEFRKLIEEIAVLMGFEALRDLPLEDVEVETPLETCMTPMIAGKSLQLCLCFAPVLEWLMESQLWYRLQRSDILDCTEIRRHMNLMNITANCRIPLIRD